MSRRYVKQAAREKHKTSAEKIKVCPSAPIYRTPPRKSVTCTALIKVDCAMIAASA